MLPRLLLLFALSSLVKGRSIVNTQPSVFSNAAFLPLQPRPNLSPRLSPRGGPNPRNRCRAWEVCKESTFYSTSEAFEPRWLTRVRGGGGNGGDRGGGDMGGDGFGGSGEGDEDGAMSWASVAGVFGSLWNQYSILLQDKPLRTKAITAGIIAILGDLVAQSLEKGWFFTRFSDSEVSKRFDTARSLAVLIDGLVVTGPGLHYLYTFLERLIPSQKGFFAAALHVAVDELIFDPLFVLGFFFLCGALEGRDLVKDIIPQVKREYWSALKGGWAVSLLFLPIEFSTFRFLPVHLRVLTVNLTDVMWTAVVSYFSHLGATTHAEPHPTPAVSAAK